MENFDNNHEENQNTWPVIIGFLWAPWLGKTVAMHVVENEENLKDVQEVEDGYVANINNIIYKKYQMSRLVLEKDYYRIVFNK